MNPVNFFFFFFGGKIHCQKFPSSYNCRFVSGKGKMKGRKYNHICWANHMLSASFWWNKQKWNDRRSHPKYQSLSWQQEIYVLVLTLADLGFTFQFFGFLQLLFNL